LKENNNMQKILIFLLIFFGSEVFSAAVGKKYTAVDGIQLAEDVQACHICNVKPRIMQDPPSEYACFLFHDWEIHFNFAMQKFETHSYEEAHEEFTTTFYGIKLLPGKEIMIYRIIQFLNKLNKISNKFIMASNKLMQKHLRIYADYVNWLLENEQPEDANEQIQEMKVENND